MVGYSLTVGWQLLSTIVVFGTLAGIAYCVWDAHKEAQELNRERELHQRVYHRYYRNLG